MTDARAGKDYSFTVKAVILGMILLGALIVTGLLSRGILYAQGISLGEENEGISSLMENPFAARMILVLQHLFLFMISPWVYLKIIYRDSACAFLPWKAPEFSDFIRFAGFLFCIYPIMSVLAIWVDLIDLPDWMSRMDESYMDSLKTLLKMETTGELVLSLLIAAVLPGVGEELLFRGVIQKELLQRWKNPHAAIWVTAILFSALHFQITGFLPKMLIGVVLGYACYFTKSLWVPIGLHMVNNAAATLALFMADDLSPDPIVSPGFTIEQGVIFIIFSTFAFIYYKFVSGHYQSIQHG
jgi:membrane protease YdiL (CAAX protease family)